jgi:prepilin-type N-terminal cleavage/methylation domain-containing protein
VVNAKPFFHQAGYTLVELLVALAVSAIVLAGTYAGYSYFSQQQQTLVGQTEVNRNALRAIDLFRADVRMAGYRDFSDPNLMVGSQAITINGLSDIAFVYDDFTDAGVFYRAYVRYYLANYTSSSGSSRMRLMREWRKCNDPASSCDHASSTAFIGSDTGEPILDWVSTFEVKGLNPKVYGSFLGQYQTIQAYLVVTSPQKVDGSSKVISKKFTILTRAKNVSLVP